VLNSSIHTVIRYFLQWRLRLKVLSLFWRSFGLLLALMCVGFALWSYGFTMRQEYSRAQALAGQLTTAVNLTRSAIMHARSTNRASLLLELNTDERVDVFVREGNDTIVSLEDTVMHHWLHSLLKNKLGQHTQLAREVNQIEGLWISFDMGGTTLGLHTYWLRVDPERIEARLKNPTWWWLWLILALVTAALGAAWLTQRITTPLTALAKRIQNLSEGVPYVPLPTHSVKEIAKVNAGMNRMAQALASQEADRRLMLAGLSHDLRTPLARLRLELEFAPLEDEQRAAMNGDISQIDMQLKQFTDYIGSDQAQLKRLNLTELIDDFLLRYERDSRCKLTTHLTPNLFINADEAMLVRLLGNVIENACRYGTINNIAYLTIHIYQQKNEVILSIKDNGEGVNSEQLSELTQPFVRGDSSRNGCEGSGLGLAIVARIAKRHEAELSLHSAIGAGFEVRLVFSKK
jgi:two-component system osmolarity sensor histidine kinase EnvZ